MYCDHSAWREAVDVSPGCDKDLESNAERQRNRCPARRSRGRDRACAVRQTLHNGPDVRFLPPPFFFMVFACCTFSTPPSKSNGSHFGLPPRFIAIHRMTGLGGSFGIFTQAKLILRFIAVALKRQCHQNRWFLAAILCGKNNGGRKVRPRKKTIARGKRHFFDSAEAVKLFARLTVWYPRHLREQSPIFACAKKSAKNHWISWRTAPLTLTNWRITRQGLFVFNSQPAGLHCRLKPKTFWKNFANQERFWRDKDRVCEVARWLTLLPENQSIHRQLQGVYSARRTDSCFATWKFLSGSVDHNLFSSFYSFLVFIWIIFLRW